MVSGEEVTMVYGNFLFEAVLKRNYGPFCALPNPFFVVNVLLHCIFNVIHTCILPRVPTYGLYEPVSHHRNYVGKRHLLWSTNLALQYLCDLFIRLSDIQPSIALMMLGC